MNGKVEVLYQIELNCLDVFNDLLFTGVEDEPKRHEVSGSYCLESEVWCDYDMNKSGYALVTVSICSYFRLIEIV